MRLAIDEMGLAAEPALVDGSDSLFHRPTAGSLGGSLCWGAGHPPNGLAADLRLEDGNDLVYTSAPLDEPVDVLGVPLAVVHVSSSGPVAHLVARLADVAPDGATEQVSEGILNLTHRDSHVEPSPLEPMRRYEVRVPLRVAGYRFPAGHRIQLRVSSSHWPVIWPSPGENRIWLHRGPDAPSYLELPLAPAGADVVDPPPFGSDAPPLAEVGSEVSEPTRWEVVNDAVAREVAVHTHEASVATLPDGISTLSVGETLTMAASEREPGAGRFENVCEYRLDRGGHGIVVIADGGIVASSTAFDMTAHLKVELDGEPFFERTWREEIARDLL